MTFQELALLVGAKSADVDAYLDRVSNLNDATAASIVFASDTKTLNAAIQSKAGAILVSTELSTPNSSFDPRLLPVRDSRYAFALAASKLRPSYTETSIHASAMIGPDVRVGRGSRIAAGVVLEEGVQIGSACALESRVTVHAGTVLGDRVIVQSGAVLGSTGFGYARDPDKGSYLLFPQQGNLIVGDDVEIGANTTIDRGALGETRIGRGTKIDNLVHIGHNCVIGEDVIIAAQTGISGSSVIQDGAILGGQVGVGEHATVGAGVILGGGAGVLSGKKMHGAGQVFWGRPARPLKEYLRDLARLRHLKNQGPID